MVHMLLNYLFSSAAILFYTLVVGLGLAEILKKKSVYFPLFFALVFGALSFVLSITGLNFWFMLLVPLFLLIPSFLKRVRRLEGGEEKLIILFIMQFFFYVVLQIFIPTYPLGGDWYTHYETAVDISNNNFQFADGRNPLFNVIEAGFFSIFGSELLIAQIVVCMTGAFIIFPYSLIGEKLLDKKLMNFAYLFLVFNPFVIENSLYNWPKMLAATLVLYFVHFLLEKKGKMMFLSGSLAFLSHSLAIFYTFPIFLLKAVKDRKYLKAFVLFMAVVVAVVLIKSALGEQNKFVLYPIAVDGYEAIQNKTTSEVIEIALAKPVWYHFFVRAVNFANTCMPTIPLLKTYSLFFEIPDIILHKIVAIESLPMIYYYFHSIPGALTFVIYAFSAVYIFRNRKSEFVTHIFLPSFVLCVFLWGYIKPGVAQDVLQPMVPLMIVFAVKAMSKYGRRALILAAVVLVVELIVFGFLYADFIESFIALSLEAGEFRLIEARTINRLIFNSSNLNSGAEV